MTISLFFVWLMGVLVFGFLAIMLWRNLAILRGQRLLLMLAVVLVLAWPVAIGLVLVACFCGVVEFTVGRPLWMAFASLTRPSA